MARSRSNFGLVGLAATGTLVVAAAAGCTTIGGIAYLINPDDVPAESTALRGKHVAVVCRPVVELEYSDAGSSRELARLVGESLRENVRRCRVIGSAEVARWLDENDWVDYPTLGKAVDADIVVGIDLEEFRMHEGSTLLKGRAKFRIRAFDIDDGKVVFDKRVDDFAYPSSGAIPSSDRSESQFRGTFLQLLSRRIARCFHAFDSREHFADDNLTF